MRRAAPFYLAPGDASQQRQTFPVDALREQLESGRRSFSAFECAAQERTYLRFYGLLAQRFCNIAEIYQ